MAVETVRGLAHLALTVTEFALARGLDVVRSVDAVIAPEAALHEADADVRAWGEPDEGDLDAASQALLARYEPRAAADVTDGAAAPAVSRPATARPAVSRAAVRKKAASPATKKATASKATATKTTASKAKKATASKATATKASPAKKTAAKKSATKAAATPASSA
ncbi:hypothetical protein [Janibacter sp. G56]|uniref:hypothetical protein n=1 Tax=Janibacter sp. G56 TaxID=3418717 RepID=UPI003D08ED87